MTNQDEQDKFEKIRERIRKEQEERNAKHKRFFNSVKSNLEEAKALKEELDKDWYVPNHFYRFYHQSFKAFQAQEVTRKCLNFFQKIGGDEFKLNDWYLQIVKEGIDKEFDLSHNSTWLETTRPLIEAMLHSKMFLDLIVKHGEDLKNEEEPPDMLDNGWAAVLYLFNER